MFLRLTHEVQNEIKFGLNDLGSITLSESGAPLAFNRFKDVYTDAESV